LRVKTTSSSGEGPLEESSGQEGDSRRDWRKAVVYRHRNREKEKEGEEGIKTYEAGVSRLKPTVNGCAIEKGGPSTGPVADKGKLGKRDELRSTFNN